VLIGRIWPYGADSCCRADRQAVKNDPEQEVRGIAVRPVGAALPAAQDLVPDSNVLLEIDEVMSVETIEAGEPMRATDVLTVVEMMLAALPSESEPPIIFGTRG
jgi:hypothetical protein